MNERTPNSETNTPSPQGSATLILFVAALLFVGAAASFWLALFHGGTQAENSLATNAGEHDTEAPAANIPARNTARVPPVAVDEPAPPPPDPVAPPPPEMRPPFDPRKFDPDKRKEFWSLSAEAFAWLTGEPSDNAVVSVGKIAEFFGMVALRVDSERGVTRAGVGMTLFDALDAGQQQQLISLLRDQKPLLAAYHANRARVLANLQQLFDLGELSETRLDEAARGYGRAEGAVALAHARAFAAVFATLTERQKLYLAQKRKEFETTGVPESAALQEQARKATAGIGQEEKKDFWSLCARAFCWFTGTPESRDFSVPGKDAQFFGFVSMRYTSEHGARRGPIGQEFFAVLNTRQQYILADMQQREEAQHEAYQANRKAMNRALEVLLKGEMVEDEKALAINQKLGLSEGALALTRARAFLEIRNSLTSDQIAKLVEIRTKYDPDVKDMNLTPIERGRRIFALCALCHRAESNGVGPTLIGVVGRKAGSVERFDYSPALKARGEQGLVWTRENLDNWLTRPQSFVIGTRMSFTGLPKAEDRKVLIDFLETLGKK